MIKVRLQIDNGDVLDSVDGYGLVYISADSRFSAPLKAFESTSYPEQEGENVIAKTVDNAFDYTVTWIVDANNSLANANATIERFNSMLYEQVGDVKTFKQVTFYNDYKRAKIVGIPSPIQEASEFWRDASGKQHDVVQVSWTIRVNKPSLCDFNYDNNDQ